MTTTRRAKSSSAGFSARFRAKRKIEAAFNSLASIPARRKWSVHFNLPHQVEIHMHSMLSRSLILALFACPAMAAHAQDSRQVTEPHIPTACATLDAAIASRHGVLSAADEQKLDTARIQSAMDGCKAGGAVVLRAHGKKNVFLTGPLELRTNVTLVIAKNTALVASRDPRLYDLSPGGCGIVAEHGHGCKPLITGDGVENSGIMGEGSIDGRGGDALLGQNPSQNTSWWDLAHEAKVKDLSQNVFALIVLRHAKNFALYEITLRNSPNFHVSVNQSDGFTAWGVKIMTPRTARNTDGIDPSSSRNVTIENCSIHTGDDDVAVKSSPAGAASNISVLHDHFYTGHGISIGSGTDGGVDHLLVDDLTIDGADNGIRIKSDRSRGGLVHDLVYKNICIRNVPNPLVFTPLYTTFSGDLLPIYRDITLKDVHVLTPGAFTFFGLDADHKLEIKLDNVFADDQ
jgi:polygalacturonase